MRKTLSLIALGLMAFTARAEVFVYKHTFTGTDIGGTNTSKFTYTGFTVMDDYGDFSQVILDPKTKTFWETDMEDTNLQYPQGLITETMFVVKETYFTADNGYDFRDYGSMSGALMDVPVNGTIWSVPKILKWSGFSMWFDADGNPYSETSSGNLTLDTKSTAVSNSFHDDMDDAINRLKQTLLLKGYVETTNVVWFP